MLLSPPPAPSPPDWTLLYCRGAVLSMRQGEERDQEGDGGQEGAPHGAAHCSVLTVSYSQFELFYLDLHILSVTCEHWDLLRSWESLEIVRPTIVTFH